MNAITSIYIPHLECHISSEYVANIFSCNGIANVSRVCIEPYKHRNKSLQFNYNRAYIDVKSWHDTEVSHNFINSLLNPLKETKLSHNDDKCWLIEINKLHNKTEKSNIFSKPFTDYTENYYDKLNDYIIDISENKDGLIFESYSREIEYSGYILTTESFIC